MYFFKGTTLLVLGSIMFNILQIFEPELKDETTISKLFVGKVDRFLDLD
jgi:hypothetical protein